MSKTNKSDIFLLIAVSAALVLGGLSLLFFPTPRFSAAENRLLADPPAFSWQALWQGDYAAAWENYTVERLTGRDVLRRTHAVCELALGKKECGAVMLCRDGSLAARSQSNEKLQERNLKGIAGIGRACREQGLPLTIALIPYRAEARACILPLHYHTAVTAALDRALSETKEKAVVLDGIQDDRAWFRTDHHWTAKGAYTAYCALAPMLGYTPYAKEDFQQTAISHRFYGTGARASGIPWISPDVITLWRYADDEAYQLCKDGKAADFNGFYDFEKVDTCDGYAVFLGGNDGLLTVEKTDEDTRPTLLLWRDSYAAALIPFLARHYRIVAIDPRYYRGDTKALLANADRALLIAGALTLAESAFLASK